ncbi:MAG: PEPxxWA-CTERM sorting domain-containing protein [Phenylobacterium sp.]|nr:PEPxxWA-CTERM sorting domain-containing protein [Phenylobacterium sp.]
MEATSLSSAVPEPATWAMMIAGFGLAGSALRSRRALIALP